MKEWTEEDLRVLCESVLRNAPAFDGEVEAKVVNAPGCGMRAVFRLRGNLGFMAVACRIPGDTTTNDIKAALTLALRMVGNMVSTANEYMDVIEAAGGDISIRDYESAAMYCPACLSGGRPKTKGRNARLTLRDGSWSCFLDNGHKGSLGTKVRPVRRLFPPLTQRDKDLAKKTRKYAIKVRDRKRKR